MGDRMTIRLAGKGEHISVTSFLDIMKDTMEILEGITRGLSTPGSNRVEWRIVSMSMNSPAELTVEGHVDGDPSRVPEEAIHTYVRGIRQLEQSRESVPNFFTVPMLDAAKHIGYTISNDGISAVTYAPDDIPPITPTSQFYANTSELIPKGYIEIGSLEGRLEVLSIHKKNYFNVYDRFTGKRVECTFTTQDLDKAKEAFGRRVAVYGRIRFNREGMPDSMSVSPDGIEVLPEQHELPQMTDLEGINITGGLDPVEYVRSLRDDARR